MMLMLHCSTVTGTGSSMTDVIGRIATVPAASGSVSGEGQSGRRLSLRNACASG
jgi:hypothetical protein